MNGAKCVVHTIEAGCNVFICYNFIILNTETVKMNFKEHKKTSKTMPVDTQHTTLDACSNHVCTLALFPRYLHTSLSFNLVTTTNIQSQIFFSDHKNFSKVLPVNTQLQKCNQRKNSVCNWQQYLRIQLGVYTRRILPFSPISIGTFDGWHAVPAGHVAP